MSDRPGLSIFDNDNHKAAPGADDATQVMAAVQPPQQRQGPPSQRPTPCRAHRLGRHRHLHRATCGTGGHRLPGGASRRLRHRGRRPADAQPRRRAGRAHRQPGEREGPRSPPWSRSSTRTSTPPTPVSAAAPARCSGSPRSRPTTCSRRPGRRPRRSAARPPGTRTCSGRRRPATPRTCAWCSSRSSTRPGGARWRRSSRSAPRRRPRPVTCWLPRPGRASSCGWPPQQETNAMRTSAKREAEQARAVADREVQEARRALAVDKERLTREAAEHHSNATGETQRLVEEAEAAGERRRGPRPRGDRHRERAASGRPPRRPSGSLQHARREAEQIVSSAQTQGANFTAAGQAEAERQLAALKAEVDRYQKRRDSIVAQLGALRDVVSGFGDDDRDDSRARRRPSSDPRLPGDVLERRGGAVGVGAGVRGLHRPVPLASAAVRRPRARPGRTTIVEHLLGVARPTGAWRPARRPPRPAARPRTARVASAGRR